MKNHITKAIVLTVLLFASTSQFLLAQTTTTINFDNTANWTAGSGSLSSYQSDHTYTEGLFSASTDFDALRQNSALQDGFAGANGTFAWRLRNSGTGAWTATIASGGVSSFSVGIRRWDNSPNPNYTLDYSIDGGITWSNVATVNNTTLANSSAYTTFNGTLNKANANILIRVNRVSGERIMIDDFVWTDFAVVLPTIYKSLTVSKKSNAHRIEWITTSELNCKFFNIQRSNDGSVFETIGTLNSKGIDGNSSENLTYFFSDDKPFIGHNYYRLEQVDLDGNLSYSDVMDIVWSSDQSVVSIYPNPTKNVLHIDVTSNKISKTKVQVVDMNGRIIKSQTNNTHKGSNYLTLDLTDVAIGVYGLEIYENNKLINATKIHKN